MKKLFLTILALCLLSSIAFGWGESSSTSSDWKSYAVTNDNGTYLLTAVSTDIIPQGSTILGYEIMGMPTAADAGLIHSENVVTVYDGGVTSLDEVLGEAECLTNTKGGEWFPYPKTLRDQIYIHQGPKTVVTIFFE